MLRHLTRRLNLRMPVLVPTSPHSPNSPFQMGRPSSTHSPTSPHLVPRRRRSIDSVSVLRLDAAIDEAGSTEDGEPDEEDPEWVKVDGVRHVEVELDARYLFSLPLVFILASSRLMMAYLSFFPGRRRKPIPNGSVLHQSAQDASISSDPSLVLCPSPTT